MKAWRDVIWDEHNTQEGKPTSYLIALLVIKAYEISDHDFIERFASIIYNFITCLTVSFNTL